MRFRHPWIKHPVRRSSLQSARGMTIVELMIVLTIIAGIMGIVGFFVFGALDDAGRKTADAQIRNIQAVLDSYYVTNRQYPTSLQDLTQGPSPAMREVPVDPWGNEYVYRRISNREYELFSMGPDEIEGTDLDVRVDR